MSDASPRIILCGATGRTGNAVAHALHAGDQLPTAIRLAACVAPSVASGAPTRALPADVPAFATLEDALAAVGTDDVVLVDLTHAEPALAHLDIALEHRIPAVIGATGFADGVIESLGERFAAADLGLLLVPNFSVGAVLAARMAYGMAQYFPDVEIVEIHHDGKRDSPSGTAIHTAELIATARERSGLVPAARPAAAGESTARGERFHGVPVHALRIPGATAHQEVVFGSPGEVVTIRHDAIDRSCYATGVAIAARYVVDKVRGLEIGLEHAL